jgi:hypothetical protein
MKGDISHDCGIIYLKDEYYIICIMSKGTTRQEADKTISLISREVYNHLSKTF